jgi:hypothetical protein
MTYSFKKPRSRAKLIEQIEKESLMMLIKSKVTLDEKRELVRERNPFLFVFGDRLVAQGSRSYEDFVNHLYLGE